MPTSFPMSNPWVDTESLNAAKLAARITTPINDLYALLPSHFMQARQTTVQSITASTATTLTNYTADFADAQFNTATGVFTCAAAGIYEAWGVVSLTAGAARNAALLAKNGTTLTQADTGTGSAVVSASLPPFRVSCAPGDTLALQAYATTTVNTSIAAGTQSFFCVRQVG